MPNAKVWKNVAVSMESALGSGLAISAITKADPGVVTSTAHGLSNGDYVVLDVQGMYQLTDRVFRVRNVASDTFELADTDGSSSIDTSDFDTFSSGTAYEITFGTTVATITNLTGSGGEFESIDTTTIHVGRRTSVLGPASELEYTFDNIWDIEDGGLIAMKAASDLGNDRAFKFTFGVGGQIMVFVGRVGATLLPTGQAQGLVVTPGKVTMAGTPTFYVS